MCRLGLLIALLNHSCYSFDIGLTYVELTHLGRQVDSVRHVFVHDPVACCFYYELPFAT